MRALRGWLALALALTVLAGCTGGPSDNALGDGGVDLAAVPGASDEAVLVGAGSSFVANLLSAWAARYRDLAPGVTIDYDALGSPAGVEALTAGSVDFATSDVPLTDLEEVVLGGSTTIYQVPWAAGAIGVAFNLPGVEDLRLTPATVAALFTGDIVRWDDPRLARDNPGVSLPDLAVSVFHRSDPSATTRLFTTFLRETARWGRGTGDQVDWPVGQGAPGSVGVARGVESTRGGVGYVQVSYAQERGLGVAQLRNEAGRFVAPTPDAVQAALAAATKRRFRATYGLFFLPASPASYALSTVTYVLYRRDMEPDKSVAMRHLVEWSLSEGQRMAELSGYVPLPQFIAKVAAEALIGTGSSRPG